MCLIKCLMGEVWYSIKTEFNQLLLTLQAASLFNEYLVLTCAITKLCRPQIFCTIHTSLLNKEQLGYDDY